MKLSTLIGFGSLALNLALAGVIVVGAFSPRPSVGPASATVTSTITTTTKETGLGPEAWSALDGKDLSAERDRLVSEGFPPSAIRAIIAAQIRETFNARRKPLELAANTPYWKTPMPDAQTMAAIRALAKEEQKAIRDVLGPDPDNSVAARLRRQAPELPPEKIEQLAAIRERYDDQRQEIYSTIRGSYTPGEREQLNALEKALHAEFAAVLTPAELENYDLRTSNTANNIRYRLSTFEPSEAEFRTLYRLQSAFDEQYSYERGNSPEQMRARQEAQKQLNDQISAALGPARYAEYQRSGDYNYQQTNQLVTRLGLPPETANSLYTVQKEFEERRNAIYRTAMGATGEDAQPQLTQQMTELQQEALARVAVVFGGNANAVEAYKQYGGSWMREMVPRPTPAGKK